MAEVAFLVPVLNRPDAIEPLLRAIYSSTPLVRVLFIADPDDFAELRRLDEFDAEVLIHPGTYAQKINAGIRNTTEPLIFVGADDLEPRPGWLTAAKDKLDPAEVVGVNDLIPRTRDHQTHFLVTRAYADRGQIDGEPGLLHEGYAHEWCDDELVAVAKHRGVYAYAEHAHVRHNHPMSGAPMDSTYEKGFATRREGRRTFRTRSHLWT